MSIPDSVELPPCTRRIELETPTGWTAALEALPDHPAVATALLVPGFTGSKEDFLPLLEELTDAGLRVITFDQRGQYESDWLADSTGYDAAGPAGRGYGTSVFAADVQFLVRSLASDDSRAVHLLGHSFGGYVVREAVLGAHADADALPIASLTLLDSGPGAVIGRSSLERLELLLALKDTLTLQQINEVSPVDEHADPHVSAFLLRRWLANDVASLAAMARRLLTEQDRTDELRALLAAWDLPCLVMSGSDEDVWSAQLLRETADRLGAGFSLIPDAGHSPNTDQPGLMVKALLEFWLS